MQDKVYTICYNRLTIYPNRKKAIDFFLDCMYCSEGSERDRYTNVYLDLLNPQCYVAKDDYYDDNPTIFSVGLYRPEFHDYEKIKDYKDGIKFKDFLKEESRLLKKHFSHSERNER